jgi:hypothetical protein
MPHCDNRPHDHVAIAALYAATAQFDQQIQQALGDQYLGAELFYAPPFPTQENCYFENLFLLDQPGGGSAAMTPIQNHQPPTINEYLTASYRVAKNMRQIFPRSALADGTGINTLFWRAPSQQEWAKITAHSTLRPQDMEQFCLQHLRQLLPIIDSHCIVIMGRQAWRRITAHWADALVEDSSSRRHPDIHWQGRIAGITTYFMPHPTWRRGLPRLQAAARSIFPDP